MQEVWKSVKGYDDRFMISSEGRLSNSLTGKILTQHKSKKGYLIHATRIGGRKGKAVLLRIHRLVAEAFLEPPSQELIDWSKTTVYGIVQVNHKDGNKNNNRPENLEWCNGSQNMKHSVKIGLFVSCKGTDNGQSKLSEDDIKQIREKYIPFDKKYGARALAEKFGVHHSQISRAVRNISYTETTK